MSFSLPNSSLPNQSFLYPFLLPSLTQPHSLWNAAFVAALELGGSARVAVLFIRAVATIVLPITEQPDGDTAVAV